MQVEICQHKVALFFVVFDGHNLLSATLSFNSQPSKQANLRGLRKKGRVRR